jgi:PBP1b-binding outer membrane lipoprotein LpoB
VKRIVGIAVVAAAILLAGCGSGSSPQAGPFSFKPGTTTTIANVKTGATIRCLGVETAPAPPLGQQATWTPDLVGAKGEIQLLHMQNGSLTVTCTR